MRRFRDLAIGRKLMLAMMLTSSAAVLLAGVTRIIYEVTAFRKVSLRDLSVQAEIIGENCAAALEFDNPQTAQETLASLKARTDIVEACVYRKDGSVLAGYVRGARASSATFPRLEAEGHRIRSGHFLLFHQITRKGENLGTVYLRSNLQQHYARLIAGIAIALGSMVAGWILALMLAMRLQRRIADPIMDLAGLADRVRNHPDYSLRAAKYGDDEIGVLTDGFNRMLENIQERDAKLRRAYDDLQSSEQRFRQLAESIREVFWLRDPEEGQVIYVSPAYETIWGRTCQSMRENPCSWLEAIHPQDQERVRQAAATKQADGRYDEEYRIVRPDSSIRWIHDRAFPIREVSGKVYRIAGIAEDVTERRKSEEALRRLSIQLLQSQDEERRRIARELHDSTGQRLAAVAMHLSAIDGACEALDPAARKALTESCTLLDECLREIRTLSYLLHPPLLDERGLASALSWYVEGAAQRSGIEVGLEISLDLQRLPREIEITLFRVVQEALTNIHRHSGSSTATIRLVADRGTICLEVRDAGTGFLTQRSDGLPETMGVGITGMHERVRQLGGRLEIQSGIKGTTLRVVLPRNGAAL
ncbi:MAG TPA: PAS domain-containing protein [Verrucomicrobiae bacterium]|nr:PAS domain-containing protein [Verrucomicrobiae bacterium]